MYSYVQHPKIKTCLPLALKWYCAFVTQCAMDIAKSSRGGHSTLQGTLNSTCENLADYLAHTSVTSAPTPQAFTRPQFSGISPSPIKPITKSKSKSKTCFIPPYIMASYHSVFFYIGLCTNVWACCGYITVIKMKINDLTDLKCNISPLIGQHLDRGCPARFSRTWEYIGLPYKFVVDIRVTCTNRKGRNFA